MKNKNQSAAKRPMPWSDEENRAIIKDYLVMMAALRKGEKINKAATRRALLPILNNRSEGSIEFKRMNISACLVALRQPYLAGYKPMDNYQLPFFELVKKLAT